MRDPLGMHPIDLLSMQGVGTDARSSDVCDDSLTRCTKGHARSPTFAAPALSRTLQAVVLPRTSPKSLTSTEWMTCNQAGPLGNAPVCKANTKLRAPELRNCIRGAKSPEFAQTDMPLAGQSQLQITIACDSPSQPAA